MAEVKRQTIFVLTDGAYSDYHIGAYSNYHIVAVFSTREKAEEYRKTDPHLSYHGGRPEWDDTQIEEWEVDQQWES